MGNQTVQYFFSSSLYHVYTEKKLYIDITFDTLLMIPGFDLNQNRSSTCSHSKLHGCSPSLVGGWGEAKSWPACGQNVDLVKECS